MLATIVGVIDRRLAPVVELARPRVAALYVETFRNIPVLVIILFWYLGVMIRLPPIRDAVEVLDLLAISNRGIVVPWFDKVGGGVAFGIFALVAFAAAAVVWIWRTRRFDRHGRAPSPRALVGRRTLLLSSPSASSSAGGPWTRDHARGGRAVHDAAASGSRPSTPRS